MPHPLIFIFEEFPKSRYLFIEKMKFPVRKRTRKKGYDYSRDGVYYFTSNTKNNLQIFGEIRNHEIQLNEYGRIVLEQWQWLEEQYPYVVSHAFIVMPNHVHGILEINRNRVSQNNDFAKEGHENKIKIKPLSELIGAFKMTSSKRIHSLDTFLVQECTVLPGFIWHWSFHDHIIKSRGAYDRIKKYIECNPVNWKYDEFNK